MAENEAPPHELKVTPFSRALLELEILLDSPNYGPFFRSVETLSGMFEEQKRLSKRISLLYFGTFIGACVILLGPLPEGLKMNFWGVEAPISLIPQQLIALMTAVAFGQYAVLFASLLMLGQMTERILRREGAESWQFFAARFDATILWVSPLIPKQVGYSSPKRHIAVALLIMTTMVASLIAHAATVCTSMVLAAWSAWKSGSVLLIVIGGGSTLISAASFITLVSLVLVRMPFRIASQTGK